MSRVLLFSGGIDCLASYAMLEGEVDALVYVDMGQKYGDVEANAALAVAGALGDSDKMSISTVMTGTRIEKDNAEIPMRNLLLVLLAGFHGNEVVVSIESGTDDNESKDRGAGFFKAVEGVYRGCGMDLTIANPVEGMTKVDEVGKIIDYFGRAFAESLLQKTFSCYNPDLEGTPCLACTACFRKFVALYANGVGGDWFMDIRSFRTLVEKYYERAMKLRSTNKRWEQYAGILSELLTNNERE